MEREWMRNSSVLHLQGICYHTKLGAGDREPYVISCTLLRENFCHIELMEWEWVMTQMPQTLILLNEL